MKNRNLKYLPKTVNWFRLPEYIKSIFEAEPDNSADLLLGFDNDGNPVIVEKSSIVGGGDQDASEVDYDNSTSGLVADNVQDALDEIVASGGSGITLTSQLTNDGEDGTSRFVEEDEITAAPVFNSIDTAVSTIGLNKLFAYSETNLDGVPSPNGSVIGITKN